MKSKSRLGENSWGLAKYDQNSSSIGRGASLLSLRDQQTQVKDVGDVNGWSLSEVISHLTMTRMACPVSMFVYMELVPVVNSRAPGGISNWFPSFR